EVRHPVEVVFVEDAARRLEASPDQAQADDVEAVLFEQPRVARIEIALVFGNAEWCRVDARRRIVRGDLPHHVEAVEDDDATAGIFDRRHGRAEWAWLRAMWLRARRQRDGCDREHGNDGERAPTRVRGHRGGCSPPSARTPSDVVWSLSCGPSRLRT